MRGVVGRAVGVLAVAALAACSTTASPDTPPPGELVPPATIDEPAPSVDVDPAVLPYGYHDRPAVSPGWANAPQTTDGVFVGTGPHEAPAMAELVAVESTGTLLWRAEVPQGTDIDLSRAGESAIVVLTVPTADDGWDASAFELRTGDPAWGPVSIPGAPADPGLLVATSDGLAAIDAATGEVAVAGATTVLAEHDGTVVLQLGEDLAAQRGRDLLWTATPTSLGLPPGQELAVVPGSTSPAGTLIVGSTTDDDAPRTGTLVDLTDGTPITTEVRHAEHDDVLDALVVAGDGTLGAFDDDGAALWTRDVPPGARLVAVDGVLAYLRVADEVLVVNTATGADAVVYDTPGEGGLAVPALVEPAGAVALNTGTWVLLPAGG